MKKTACFTLVLLLLCVFALSSCDKKKVSSDKGNESANEESAVCEHDFTDWFIGRQASCRQEGEVIRVCPKCGKGEKKTIEKSENHTAVVTLSAVPATCNATGLTEGSYCSACGKTITPQITLAKLKHIYDQKNVAVEYLRTKATSSASATYYYSCNCGAKGTEYLSYGSSLALKWTPCNKTVYGIADTCFYAAPDSKGVCGYCKVGYPVNVVSSNGEWYEVDKNNIYANCVAYIKCSDVTDNYSFATFVEFPLYGRPEGYLNYSKGAYLRKDITGREESKVGFIRSGHTEVVSMNKTKNWIAVKFSGDDSQGRHYDETKIYYCLASKFEIVGLPANWS